MTHDKILSQMIFGKTAIDVIIDTLMTKMTNEIDFMFIKLCCVLLLMPLQTTILFI